MYLQKTAQLAQQDVKILAMLEAEMALSTVIEEVNRIITHQFKHFTTNYKIENNKGPHNRVSLLFNAKEFRFGNFCEYLRNCSLKNEACFQ